MAHYYDLLLVHKYEGTRQTWADTCPSLALPSGSLPPVTGHFSLWAFSCLYHILTPLSRL